jgi:hypothetical protein
VAEVCCYPNEFYVGLLTLTAQRSLYVPRGLTFSNSTFCPHSVFTCFVWISEQTAIISLYSINWLVFITDTECVYWAVRTGSSNISQVNFVKGRALPQAVSRRPLPRSGFDPGSVHVIFMADKVAPRQGFLTIVRFCLSVSFHQFSIFTFLYMLPLPEGQTGEAWEPSKKQAFSGIGERWVVS